MKAGNTLKLGKLVFPVTHATFFRLSEPGAKPPEWEFEIRTGPPVDIEKKSSITRLLYGNGIRLYSEGDPIPLPEIDDLSGVELYLKPAFDPTYNDPYFTLYVSEHGDVSEVRLKFGKRRGKSYDFHLTGRAHNINKRPLALELTTVIKWQQARPS